MSELSTKGLLHFLQQVPDPRGRLSGRLSKPDTDILGDAAYCQQDVCETITQNNGDYLLIVKANQPKLHRAAQQSFVIPKDPQKRIDGPLPKTSSA